MPGPNVPFNEPLGTEGCIALYNTNSGFYFTLIYRALAVSQINPEHTQPHDTVLWIRPGKCAGFFITAFYHGFPLFLIHTIPQGTAYGRRQARHVQHPSQQRRALYVRNLSLSPSLYLADILHSRWNCSEIGQLHRFAIGFFHDLDSSSINPQHFPFFLI